jgi:hypothetical protein
VQRQRPEAAAAFPLQLARPARAGHNALPPGTHAIPKDRAMRPEDLYRLLGQKPFQPVRVHLKGGGSYDIVHRQLAVVGETWLDVGIKAPDERLPIAEEVVTIPLEDIRDVERLAAEAGR